MHKTWVYRLNNIQLIQNLANVLRKTRKFNPTIEFFNNSIKSVTLAKSYNKFNLVVHN